ncbi:MAG: glycoside hydrolase family 3 N-terminal domain-containing protein [Gemmatimonadota bacterium]
MRAFRSPPRELQWLRGQAAALALVLACANPSLAQSPEGAPGGEGRGGAEYTWSTATLETLSLRQKAGQVLMPLVEGAFTPAGSESLAQTLDAIEKSEVGGLIVTMGSPTEVAVKLNYLQGLSRLPLLVGADLEEGPGFRFDGIVRLPGAYELGGATTFPSLMAIGATGDPQYAYQAGLATGREALALGIHLPFAPVLDVNNNPDNPIINTRSFGEDAERVAAMGALFVRGIQEAGAIATGKHFPGHGDTDTDSHFALPVIRSTRSRLDSLELVPFRRAIDDGIGAIMTAHISLPEITGEQRLPATLSGKVLTDLLQRDLGFSGLVVTDAMNMGAIDRAYGRGEAAVRALMAGADIILMPPNPEVAINAIVTAVEAGRLPEARLDEAVTKILRAKERLGLDRRRTVDVAGVVYKVGIPEHREIADEIAAHSMTLIKNDRVLPLRGTRRARVLSLTYRRESDLLAGRSFDRVLRETYPRLRTESVYRDTDAGVYERLAREARQYELVVISTYVAAVTSSTQIGVAEGLARLVQSLSEAGVPHVVVSFGSPYLIRDFPTTRAYVAAWSGSGASQRAAAAALFGRAEFAGHLPTRISEDYPVGFGLTLQR